MQLNQIISKTKKGMNIYYQTTPVHSLDFSEIISSLQRWRRLQVDSLHIHCGKCIHSCIIASWKMYVSCADIEYALKLFDNSPKWNVVVLTCLIAGYEQLRLPFSMLWLHLLAVETLILGDTFMVTWHLIVMTFLQLQFLKCMQNVVAWILQETCSTKCRRETLLLWTVWLRYVSVETVINHSTFLDPLLCISNQLHIYFVFNKVSIFNIYSFNIFAASFVSLQNRVVSWYSSRDEVVLMVTRWWMKDMEMRFVCMALFSLLASPFQVSEDPILISDFLLHNFSSICWLMVNITVIFSFIVMQKI